MATAEQIARSYIRAEEARDLDAVMRHYSGDAVFRAPGVALEGAEIARYYREAFERFPSLKGEVLRTFGEGRVAAIEWQALLTDAAGVVHEVHGVNIVEVDGERMTSVRSYFDPAELETEEKA